jgi:hypothetical protein
LLGGVKLAAEDGEHVHAGVRFFLEKDHDVIAVDFEAFGFLQCYGIGLVRRLFEHGSEPEKFSMLRLVDDDLLMVFVHGCDADFAANHDVSVAIGVADFVDALARSEFL